MPHMSVNGVNLHYHQVGQGPNVVMVHGITGNMAIWHLEIIPALMGQYRLTTYDLRGHGYSDAPPTGYTTADHALELNRLMDALDIGNAHLVGHSFGADIALHYTILYPERVDRLVLVEPTIPALLPLRQREDWVGWKYWRDRLSEGGVTVPQNKWYDQEYLVRESVRIPKIFGFRRGLPRRSTSLVRLMDTTTAASDFCKTAGMTLEKIAEVRHKTLVVYGEGSAFLGSYEYLKDHLPNCTPVLMADSEHFGPLEQPTLLIESLQNLFNEHITG